MKSNDRQMTGKLDAGDNAARLAELLSPRLVRALAAVSHRCGFFRRAGGRLRARADGDGCTAPGVDRDRSAVILQAEQPIGRAGVDAADCGEDINTWCVFAALVFCILNAVDANRSSE